ncbi:hypothetical protein PC113_g4050 [Phytophthora cactorum]|uniref:Uncharacterized protein n=1 Tax=Phytophthora cactorum TaxID=29920 RepID=A0A8T0ZSY1_9STRA|nr:hypothetical protein PC111_g2975 [Phytophthora cactorum]KAG2865071.1 hypothetical protein PC113_g4050 [Phytophthora cactorum]
MKHIDTRYHFVRERIATEEGGVEYVNTKDNVADLLAKAVSADVMETLRPGWECGLLARIRATRSRVVLRHSDDANTVMLTDVGVVIKPPKKTGGAGGYNLER